MEEAHSYAYIRRDLNLVLTTNTTMRRDMGMTKNVAYGTGADAFVTTQDTPIDATYSEVITPPPGSLAPGVQT